MICYNVIRRLDDYLDDRLDTLQQRAVQDHLRHCPRCRYQHEQNLTLRVAVRALPIPVPRPGFAEEALSRASATYTPAHPLRQPAVRLALAASLVIGIALGLLLNGPNWQPAEAPVQTVSMGLEQPQTVRLMFTSAKPLSGVTMSVALPDNIELVGFNGRRELSWQTDLREGENLLQLPLIARGPAGGELVAQLTYGDSRKTFRVQIQLKPAGAAVQPRVGT